MHFGSKPTFVLFLRPASLDFYDSKKSEAVTLYFTQDAVRNQEIYNLSILEQSIMAFLKEYAIPPSRAIFVLSQEILYQKALPLVAASEEAAQQQRFLDEIPFDTSALMFRKIRTGTELYLIATNKHFYLPVTRLFERLNWKIAAVIPSINQDHINDNYVLDPGSITAILKTYQSKKEANFLMENNNTVSSESQPSIAPVGEPHPVEQVSVHPHTKRLIFIGGTVIFLLLVTALVLFFLKPKFLAGLMDGKSPTTQKAAVSPSPTLTASPTASASAQIVPAEVKISVLNGTMTTGLAGKVAEILEQAGYTNTTTGNAPTRDVATTGLVFSSKVPKTQVEEIAGLLQEDYPKLTREEATGSAEFDVVVTIGKE